MNQSMATLSHLESHLGWRHETAPPALPSKLEAIDKALGGWPRGRISEIIGDISSGRTTLLHRVLAEAGAGGEICAVVDAMDAFDPATAELHGVALHRLVWVRCGGNLEHAMHATDLLLHSGGLGVVAIDLCGADTLQNIIARPCPRIGNGESLRRRRTAAPLGAGHLSRIPPSYWFRFRRAVEASQTICLVLADRPVAKSCSTLIVETQRRQTQFTRRLFRELACRVSVRKPPTPSETELRATAVAPARPAEPCSA